MPRLHLLILPVRVGDYSGQHDTSPGASPNRLRNLPLATSASPQRLCQLVEDNGCASALLGRTSQSVQDAQLLGSDRAERAPWFPSFCPFRVPADVATTEELSHQSRKDCCEDEYLDRWLPARLSCNAQFNNVDHTTATDLFLLRWHELLTSSTTVYQVCQFVAPCLNCTAG